MAQLHNENQQSDKSTTETMINKNGNNSEESDKVIHPENGIILMDNTILKCFPNKLPHEDVVPDVVSLDTSGEYLTIGNYRHKPDNTKSDIEESKALQQLFTDNAFYLLGHRERIMQDSRMFLAPVEVQSGLAYSGTSGFRCPTIGVYLEWWATCAQAMHTDENGCRSLVYRLSGPPLSGSNKSALYSKTGRQKLSGFRHSFRIGVRLLRSTRDTRRLNKRTKHIRCRKFLISCGARMATIRVIYATLRSSSCSRRLNSSKIGWRGLKRSLRSGMISIKNL